MKEYIGITGYKNLDEINEMKKAYADAGINKDSEMGAMFGFLVLAKQTNDTTLEGRRNPSLQNLAGLLKEVPDWMLPTMHYCSYARNLDVDTLSSILDYKNIAAHTRAVQLNLDWPAAENIADVKQRFPHLYIIQQINPNFPGVDIIKRVMEYEGLVDKLLIDPSLGAGIGYKIMQTADVINQIAEKTNRFSYVVCGGLDKDNVRDNIMASRWFVNPEFSIDAEGRLRTADGTGLDLDNSREYILNASKTFEETKLTALEQFYKKLEHKQIKNK